MSMVSHNRTNTTFTNISFALLLSGLLICEIILSLINTVILYNQKVLPFPEFSPAELTSYFILLT